MDLLTPLVTIASLLLLAQALFTLYLMLYAWEYPDRLEANRGPRRFRKATLSFTVLLPARNEEEVIYHTIRSVAAANYPADLLEIVVVTSDDDERTNAEVLRAMADLPHANVRLETFSGEPVNKPRGLNVGFARSRHQVVTIFDAEDDIHPDIFNVVNTVMLREKVRIVQAGVQLMNFRDHWYSLHNCLEYFFWFKSRLHFHAQVGMIPLGGNTVFIRRKLIERVGGWDEKCLTEDADIGIRLSTLAEPIRVVYDAAHVTREETPDTISSLIRQRTRWSQGFIQVLRKGDWTRLPRFRQRILAVYTLGYPILHVLLMLLWPVAIFGGFFLKLPVWVTMVAFLPLYAIVFQFLVFCIGAYAFVREYGQRLPIHSLPMMAITFLPYQWILGVSAIRAAYRELEVQTNWEKTAHIGAHRRDATGPAPLPASAPAGPVTPPAFGHGTASPAHAPAGSVMADSGPVRARAQEPRAIPASLWAGAVLLVGISLVVASLSLPSSRVVILAIAALGATWLTIANRRALAGALTSIGQGRRPAGPLDAKAAPRRDPADHASMSWVRESIGSPRRELLAPPGNGGPRLRALFQPRIRECQSCHSTLSTYTQKCGRCGALQLPTTIVRGTDGPGRRQ